MEGVRVISSKTIHARSHDPPTIHHLTPSDLHFLRIGRIQRGLLFHNPTTPQNDIVQHLQHSLSSALSHFPPLAGRLSFHDNLHDNTRSVSVLCNNAGALFIHAVAHHTTLSDILHPPYVPPILRHFFHLNGLPNDDASRPLLAVQVTELLDAVFVSCSVNHCVADGTSFWHFFNSWAEISRGLLPNPPVLERWFPNHVHPPIRFPIYAKQKQDYYRSSPPHPQRMFHFTKQKIAHLKAKANAEVNDNKITISSLQAVLSHIWRCVIGNQRVHDPEEKVGFVILVSLRERMADPPLSSRNYFGNAVTGCMVSMKAGELVGEGGMGKAALEMKNGVGSYTREEVIREYYEGWMKEPFMVEPGGNARGDGDGTTTSYLVASDSPRFDIYGNDFGWGPPVGVRSAPVFLSVANGNVTLFQGAQEGSIDVDLSLPHHILEAMANDSHFMHPL